MVAILRLESCTDRLWDPMHEPEYLGDWMEFSLLIYLFHGLFQLCMLSNW